MAGLLHSFLYYLFGRGISSVIMLAQLVFLTSILPAEEYGRYSYVFSSALLFNALLFLWLRVFAVRYLAERGYDTVYRIVFRFFFVSYAAGIAVLAVVSAAGNVLDIVESAHLALLFFMLGWFETNVEIFRAQIEPKRFNQFLILKSVAVLCCTVGVVWQFPHGMGGVLGCSAGYAAVNLPMTLMLWKRLGPRERGAGAGVSISRDDVVYGISLSGGVIISNLFIFVEKSLIAHFVGGYSLGVFSMVHDFGYKFLVLPIGVVNQSFLPITVRKYTQGRLGEVVEQVRKNFSALVLLGSFASLFVVVLRQELSALLFPGTDSRVFIDLLPILAASIITDAIRKQCFDVRFYLKGVDKRFFLYSGIFVVAGLALRVLFISACGVTGAFAAMGTVALLGLLLSNYYGDKSIALRIPYADIGKVLCSSLAAVAAAGLVRGDGLYAALLFKGVLFCVVFASAVLALDILGIRNRLKRVVHG